MGNYINKEDLIDELGEEKLIELTDDVNSGEVNDPRVDKAISYAEGTFDGYARTRYQIPVPVTTKVKAVCLDLAVFHLYKARATSATKEGKYGVVKDAHDAALKFLTDVSAGKAGLDVPSAEETVMKPASPDEILRGSSKSATVFSDEKLSGY